MCRKITKQKEYCSGTWKDSLLYSPVAERKVLEVLNIGILTFLASNSHLPFFSKLFSQQALMRPKILHSSRLEYLLFSFMTLICVLSPQVIFDNITNYFFNFFEAPIMLHLRNCPLVNGIQSILMLLLGIEGSRPRTELRPPYSNLLQ